MSSTFPLSFLDLIVSKILNFSYKLLSVLRLSRKIYCSTTPTYHDNSKKRFYLKDTAKNTIKTWNISNLLNTDLGNLNDLRLILKNDHGSMYNTIYIFLKFTCPVGKKTKTYFLKKTKPFFQNQSFG